MSADFSWGSIRCRCCWSVVLLWNRLKISSSHQKFASPSDRTESTHWMLQVYACQVLHIWPWLCENHSLVLIWRKWVFFCLRSTLHPCTIMWQNILWKLSLFAEIWALLWNTRNFIKTHKTSQKSGFVVRLWNGKNSSRKSDSSKWNRHWICCYLPCEQKVNTVFHLRRNWLPRSWTGDITVFRVAVLVNLLGEVLGTLVWVQLEKWLVADQWHWGMIRQPLASGCQPHCPPRLRIKRRRPCQVMRVRRRTSGTWFAPQLGKRTVGHFPSCLMVLSMHLLLCGHTWQIGWGLLIMTPGCCRLRQSIYSCVVSDEHFHLLNFISWQSIPWHCSLTAMSRRTYNILSWISLQGLWNVMGISENHLAHICIVHVVAVSGPWTSTPLLPWRGVTRIHAVAAHPAYRRQSTAIDLRSAYTYCFARWVEYRVTRPWNSSYRCTYNPFEHERSHLLESSQLVPEHCAFVYLGR